MSVYRLNTRALLASVDERRQLFGLSWRALGRRLGISASVFTNMKAGRAPDAHALITMLIWLGANTLHAIAAESCHECGRSSGHKMDCAAGR